jgi:uncharacterized protein YaeQ
MAPQATIYSFDIAISDVDRSVYETVSLRVAQHPSETLRYLLTRLLGYCLSYEEGIAFSKGGLSSSEEPPVSIHDPTGVFLAWIDVGAPSAERLHKASKAARRVVLYTHVSLALLRKEAATRAIHALEEIEVWLFDKAFLDALEAKIERKNTMELTRNEGQLYVTIKGASIEGAIVRESLVS